MPPSRRWSAGLLVACTGWHLRVSVAAGACLALLAGCALVSAPLPPAVPAPVAAAARPAGVQATADTLPPNPEAATGLQAKPGWLFPREAVAAANPLATAAGAQVLREGGSALDAAVAVQMVLALVEPQSSGLGGGAFLMHWDGRSVQAWDGRETAPAGADERLFLLPDGRPMPLPQAVVGGRAVGTPGAVRMLEAAHRQHGRLPWARLMAPAIRLADEGFELSPRLHQLLQGASALRSDPQAGPLYYDATGQARPVGYRLRNPALAALLRRIALEGSAALHTGPAAEDMVKRVRGHASNPGQLSLADLAGYQPLQRAPLCADWLVHLRVCGMPPPSSGQLAVMQILGMLARLPAPAPGQRATLDAHGRPSAAWLHRYTEASRLAFADRALYVADPAFVPAPAGDWASLLGDAYLRQRAALVGDTRMPQAPAGSPGGQRSAFAAQAEQAEHGTSHISIVDRHGHAVAMTTTIEAVFGAQLMSDGGTGLPGGFLLNNELTDFSLQPRDAAGRSVANRVEPGKRPRSSMSPTLVFDRRDGRLLMTLGSPGGPAIIHFTTKTLLGTLAWGLDAQRAIDLPNFGSFGGPLVLEAGRFPEATVAALQALGHRVVSTDLPSGLQAIARTPEGWSGGADPRREGVVMGD